MLLLGRIAGDWTTLVLPDVVVDTGVTEHKPVRGEQNHLSYCIWIAKFSYTFSAKNETVKRVHRSIPQFDVNKIITTLFYLFNSII